MQPEIYVTIVAHTPFLISPAQQVLVQGWLVTLNNINQLTNFVEKQLNILEEKIASVTAIANQQLDHSRVEYERLVGGLFEESNSYFNKNSSHSVLKTSIISPESSFINMLRYGMLALTLLPEHSCARKFHKYVGRVCLPRSGQNTCIFKNFLKRNCCTFFNNRSFITCIMFF